MELWRTLVAERFGELRAPTEDKVVPLGDAIRRHVRPGMKLNACSLQSRPCAAIYELCRVFAGTDPKFEFISSSIGGTYLALLHLKMLRKIIVSFAGEAYPTPGPSPLVARALASGVEIENLTMLTIPQRLLAGALGVPFITTRSLAGSSLADEAPDTFREIPDPFDPVGRAGALKAYRPDIAFVHAWAADPSGNAICHAPLAENVYGALAATEGVILTVDHLVSHDFVRRHAHLGRLPGQVVRSVSVCPYGAHPTGNFAHGIPEFESYANDYDFMKEHRRAQKSIESYDAWCADWIFGPGDHLGYLRRLGEDRLARVRFLATPESWRAELEEHAASLSEPRPVSAIETMIVQGAREFARRMKALDLRTVLSGVGQASLMTWLAERSLRAEGIDVDLMAEVGFYGHDPRPADPFVFNYRNLPTTTMLTDIFETLGIHTGGAGNRCLGAIGAAQVDRRGNVNSTRVGGKFIVGSGGANDIASAARETVILARQSRDQFVERVDYVTSPGRNVRLVVSTMGRFEKRGDGLDGDELILTGVFGEGAGGAGDAGRPGEASLADAARAVRDRCGWDLRVADDLERLPDPTPEEVATLRMFDPERHFLGKE